MESLVFWVNGRRVEEPNPDPEWTLLFYLRKKLRLTGAKEACGEGGCGSCTVIISRFDAHTGIISNLAINACLTPICSVHGSAIITVEGLGSVSKGLHPVQERIAKSHGTQCGFCTPGFVMSMYALLRNNPKPTQAQMEAAFRGNLCRCTGYRPILQGFRGLCSDFDGNCGAKGGCCKSGSDQSKEIGTNLFEPNEFMKYDPEKQDPIFPPQLKLDKSILNGRKMFGTSKCIWYRPANLSDTLEILDANPNAKIVAGSVDLSTDRRFDGHSYTAYLQIGHIPELRTIQIKDGQLEIGSCATIEEFRLFCIKNSKSSFDLIECIAQLLDSFAGVQIRNSATIGGNIMGSGTTFKTIFQTLQTKLFFETEGLSKSSKLVEMSEPKLQNGILTKILIPLQQSNNEYFSIAKQPNSALVKAFLSVELNPKSEMIENIKMALSKESGVPKLSQISENLKGKKWERSLLADANSILKAEFPGQDLTGLFYKFFLQVEEWRGKALNTSEKNAILECSREPIKNDSHLYQIVPPDQSVEDLVGRPIPHISSSKHATGEAIYVDDIPSYEYELVGSLVRSKIAKGRILKIDPSEALALPGVIAFYSADSLPPKQNEHTGMLGAIQQMFISEKISHVGETIGIIIAKTQPIADKAANLVKVQVQEEKPILTLDEAIRLGSFDGIPHVLSCGDAEKVLGSSEFTLEGEISISGQEHWYMETQSVLSIPKEDGEMEVFISCQNATAPQKEIAHLLGIHANKVVVKIKRIGGGFGGKESRTTLVSLPASFAANELGLPVRIVLNRREDMATTGGRHPFLCRYKVGFEKNGRIRAISATLFANGGACGDLSDFVLQRAITTFDSAYNIPAWHLEGFVCKTNLPSNTAFRGFGAPQSNLFVEHIFEQVGEHLGLDQHLIREMVLYKDGDPVPHSIDDGIMANCTVRKCWAECIVNADFEKRRESIAKFNKANQWRRRGIFIGPMKFAIGFAIPFLNQGAALVMIYEDGSVQVNSGAIEMGQGLHTKIFQIASRALGVSPDKILVSETASDKVPNALLTAASIGTDFFGMAVKIACDKLRKRLEPIINQNPDGKWEEWIKMAFFSRINLSATGFYSVEAFKKMYVMEKREGQSVHYYSFGVGCSEVELDCLTGEHRVLRSDIVLDVGESINPAIDIGQIEGAFLQGLGLYTLEELTYSPEGHMTSLGSRRYKIPTVDHAPKEFNVSLLRGASNPKAVYSSKAIGEPPFMLALTVLFAIKEAIKEFRRENKLPTAFRLDSPATTEKIKLALSD